MLAARADDECARIEAYGRVWLPEPAPADLPTFNVVVCGAGMSGLAIAFGLKRRGVEGVALIDRRERGAEGPWAHCARMKTLRSPKHLAGPDLGVPALTPRSWYEAVYGEAAWEALDKFDRFDWADYLAWFGEVTRPTVHNGCGLVGVEPDPFGLALQIEGGGLPRRVRCRRLVLATGIAGSGAPRVPEFMRALPKAYWTHSAESRPDPSFAGRDFVVLGAAASSIDWAVAALEGGARRVDLLAREPRFAKTEVLDWTNFPGLLNHLPELDDARRWRFAELYFRLKAPPTQDQFDRAHGYPNFHVSLGRDLRGVDLAGGRVIVRHDAGATEADHLLLGTGYETDISTVEPLDAVADRLVFWRDRRPAETGVEAGVVGAHPYLGPGFELIAKDAARDGWLSRIHLFNNAAVASLGPISNGVTGMKFGAPRIVDALCGALFAERADALAGELQAYNYRHFDSRGVGEPVEGETAP